MSLRYKFDKHNEENKTDDVVQDVLRYDTPISVRSLDLVDSKGEQYSFNYAFLMSGKFSASENKIWLFFNTHTITIEGRNLEIVFGDISVHAIKKMACSESRYESLKEEGETFIAEITLKENV